MFGLLKVGRNMKKNLIGTVFAMTMAVMVFAGCNVPDQNTPAGFLYTVQAETFTAERNRLASDAA